jgi:hypothetical protein
MEVWQTSRELTRKIYEMTKSEMLPAILDLVTKCAVLLYP